MIPLVDLRAQHQQIAEQVRDGFEHVLGQAAFILGDEVATFEKAFASFVGVQHCVGVASGTDALELALRAVDIGPGDEVIVPVNSFVASAFAVARSGATPVFVDCDPTYHLIDTQQVSDKIGARTKAIMPVHLYGQVAAMEKLQAIAQARGVVLIEDAAQAHGAKRHGKAAGGFGIAAGTSFYPGKNLGAYGDGGAVLTNSEPVATKVRALRNYGSEVKYYHPEIGFNSRLDSLQAVVLNAKLLHLAAWNEARRDAARRYDELLATLSPVAPPATLAGNDHIWHLYVVRVPRRDALLQRLHSAGIDAGVHYPVPMHLQGAFRHLGYKKGDFPVAEAAAADVLSLPLFPSITLEQQRCVVRELREALT